MATIRTILFQEHTSLPETEEQLVEILVLRLYLKLKVPMTQIFFASIFSLSYVQTNSGRKKI